MWRLTLALLACGGSILGEDGGTQQQQCKGDRPACRCGGEATCVSGEWSCARCDGPGGGECATQSIGLEAVRNQLRACCPSCKKIQCTTVVEDVCCPLTVNSGDTKLFSELVAEYKRTCTPACPNTPCPAPANTCKQLGADPNTGQCQ